MLEEHGPSRSTRSSRLARLARQSRMCRVESSRAKWNLSLTLLDHPVCYWLVYLANTYIQPFCDNNDDAYIRATTPIRVLHLELLQLSHYPLKSWMCWRCTGGVTKVYEKASTSAPPASLPRPRLAASDSGTEKANSTEGDRHFDKHVFEHTFHGFPPSASPVPNDRSSDHRYN